MQSTPERKHRQGNRLADQIAKNIASNKENKPLIGASMSTIIIERLSTLIYTQDEINWAEQKGHNKVKGKWHQLGKLIHLPKIMQWKALKGWHDSCHFGRDKFTQICSQIFTEKGLNKTIQPFCQGCHACNINNPQGGCLDSPHLFWNLPKDGAHVQERIGN